MLEPGFGDPQPGDVQHLVRQIEPNCRLRAAGKQREHPARAGAEVDHLPKRPLGRGGQDRGLDVGVGDIERAQLVPQRGVAFEIGLGLGRPFRPDFSQTVTISAQTSVMLIDDRQDTVENGPAGRVGGESVEGPAAVGEAFDQSAGGEKTQMPGDAGLALVHDLAEFHDRQFLGGQERDDAQPRGLAGRAQDVHPFLQPERHKDIPMSLCEGVKLSS